MIIIIITTAAATRFYHKIDIIYFYPGPNNQLLTLLIIHHWTDKSMFSCTWCLHPLVVVGVDAHFVLLEVEGELARVDGTQLVMAVQVGPSPKAAVDYVRQPLTVRHLQASVQRSNPGT